MFFLFALCLNYVNMKNIYLVGFMGTGKTSVGKELAKKKKRPFLDLDDLIELREKRIISEIFSEKGEPYFRKAEKKALKEVSKEKNFVVACGGGIVLDTQNIKIMKKTGVIICLSASVDVIFKRILGSTRRPLLNVADPKKQIEFLLRLRSPYYALADAAINTSRLSIEKAAEKINDKIRGIG